MLLNFSDVCSLYTYIFLNYILIQTKCDPPSRIILVHRVFIKKNPKVYNITVPHLHRILKLGDDLQACDQAARRNFWASLLSRSGFCLCILKKSLQASKHPYLILLGLLLMGSQLSAVKNQLAIKLRITPQWLCVFHDMFH